MIGIPIGLRKRAVAGIPATRPMIHLRWVTDSVAFCGYGFPISKTGLTHNHPISENECVVCAELLRVLRALGRTS